LQILTTHKLTKIHQRTLHIAASQQVLGFNL